MALPLIAAIAAGVTLVVGGIVVYKIYIDGVGQVEVKEGKEDDKADITVLLVGEKGAGKKTLTNVIRKGKFPTEVIKMFNAYTSLKVSHSSAFYSMETWGSKMVKYSFAVLVPVSAPACSGDPGQHTRFLFWLPGSPSDVFPPAQGLPPAESL